MSIPKKGGEGANSEPEENANKQAATPLESMIHNSRVQTVIHFMKANLQRSISLPELADVANLSASQFSHVFKTQTGISPMKYLRRLRMERARQLLATSGLSVKEIMAMSGYNSKNHFARDFKRYFGLPPSKYRNSGSGS